MQAPPCIISVNIYFPRRCTNSPKLKSSSVGFNGFQWLQKIISSNLLCHRLWLTATNMQINSKNCENTANYCTLCSRPNLHRCSYCQWSGIKQVLPQKVSYNNNSFQTETCSEEWKKKQRKTNVMLIFIGTVYGISSWNLTWKVALCNLITATYFTRTWERAEAILWTYCCLIKPVSKFNKKNATSALPKNRRKFKRKRNEHKKWQIFEFFYNIARDNW